MLLYFLKTSADLNHCHSLIIEEIKEHRRNNHYHVEAKNLLTIKILVQLYRFNYNPQTPNAYPFATDYKELGSTALEKPWIYEDDYLFIIEIGILKIENFQRFNLTFQQPNPNFQEKVPIVNKSKDSKLFFWHKDKEIILEKVFASYASSLIKECRFINELFAALRQIQYFPTTDPSHLGEKTYFSTETIILKITEYRKAFYAGQRNNNYLSSIPETYGLRQKVLQMHTFSCFYQPATPQNQPQLLPIPIL